MCKISEIPRNRGKKFIIDDVSIAVFKVDDKIYAVDNVCPHQHSDIMHEGFVENGYVICPAHGWMFSLETGSMKSSTGCKLMVHDLIIEGDLIYIKVKKKTFNW